MLTQRHEISCFPPNYLQKVAQKKLCIFFLQTSSLFWVQKVKIKNEKLFFFKHYSDIIGIAFQPSVRPRRFSMLQHYLTKHWHFTQKYLTSGGLLFERQKKKSYFLLNKVLRNGSGGELDSLRKVNLVDFHCVTFISRHFFWIWNLFYLIFALDL